MSWYAFAIKVFVVIAVAAAVGALYGRAIEVVTLALLALFGFWLYQMYRVQRWLKGPEGSPPDAHGLWGELLARIYFQQRKNSEAQAQLQATVEYLQDSFAAMRDGVVMVDENGAIKWLNHEVEQLMGLR